MIRKVEEDKVTYQDGSMVRVLRGRIVEEDENRIVLQRLNGRIELSRKIILKIERRDC
jgi:hypothetical protein